MDVITPSPVSTLAMQQIMVDIVCVFFYTQQILLHILSLIAHHNYIHYGSCFNVSNVHCL